VSSATETVVRYGYSSAWDGLAQEAIQLAFNSARAGQGGVQVTQELLLGFAVLLEVPILMIVLSRLLRPAANRWANTIAAAVTTVFVVAGGSADPHHVFFTLIEVACMSMIVRSVWIRRPSQTADAQRVV
jgi:Sec-independent protein secretion pathway component TatC